MTTQLPVTLETYWKIKSVEPSGRAWDLYCFYVQAALRKNSSQPLATDHFCKKGLRWGSINTVAKMRLKLVEAGAIEHIKTKWSFNYIRINYMTVTLSNKLLELSTEPIPPAMMGTAQVFDYYAKWWDRLYNACLDEFSIRLKKEMGTNEKPDFDEMLHHLNTVWERIQTNAKCITTMDTELRFWGHLLHSVGKEFQRGKKPAHAY